jgi:hypothetical protein
MVNSCITDTLLTNAEPLLELHLEMCFIFNTVHTPYMLYSVLLLLKKQTEVYTNFYLDLKDQDSRLASYDLVSMALHTSITMTFVTVLIYHSGLVQVI